MKILQKDLNILEIQDNLNNNIDEFINFDCGQNLNTKEKLEQEKLQISESINSVTDEVTIIIANLINKTIKNS